ncbi:tyrosinase family protein [Lysobacter korlensis]|uniref:Tyrosinase family protein n=1 Tax=Lysobacter korlensis TaxID=553636 RepID=A0ABV6RUK0_9GAMM
MQSPSRRNFVRGLATVPFGLWLASNAYANTHYVRYDIATPEGQEMLKVFADAVKLMKARSEADPRSWTWQWYTHFVAGNTTKANELTRIFGDTVSPMRTLADEMWNTCQSHAGQNANNFLPWHRIYVWYMEQIVRDITGRPDFTLPYWNYTSHDPAKRGIVPAQFRMATDPVFGSLYRSNRTSLANTGKPIHQAQPTDSMDISAAMAAANYSTVGEVQGFCRAIDSGIHGQIHVLTGTTSNMGKISYAAQDPLFWVHHANVDRLWASWNRNGGLNPSSGTWQDRSFVFVDRVGQRVVGKLRDFFDCGVLGYGYDRLVASNGHEDGTMSTLSARSALSGPATRVPERIASAASVELGARPVRTQLKLGEGKPLTALDPSGRRRTYLVVKDLHTWEQPEVLYHLYLTPRGNGPARALHVGTINFFDAEFHDHGNSKLDEALGENFYSFDVTQVLQQLARNGVIRPDAPLELTVVPGGTPAAGAKPLVGSIRLVWQ